MFSSFLNGPMILKNTYKEIILLLVHFRGLWRWFVI